MIIIKTAIQNIYRYKRYYYLFGFLYLILLIVTSVSVVIFINMNDVRNNTLYEQANIVRFLPADITGTGTLPKFTIDTLLSFKENEHINDIMILRYTFSTGYTNLESSMGTAMIAQVYTESGLHLLSVPPGFSYRPVFIFGYNMSMLDFSSSYFNLESGRMFENDFEAVIRKNPVSSADYGTWNDLNIGDKIILRSDKYVQYFMYPEGAVLGKRDEGLKKEFTIVGILPEIESDDEYINRRIVYTTYDSAKYFHSIAGTDLIGIRRGIDHNIHRIDPDPKNNFQLGHDALIYLTSPENLFRLQDELFNMNIFIEIFFPGTHELIRIVNISRSNAENFIVLFTLILLCVMLISSSLFLRSRKYDIEAQRLAGTKRRHIIASYTAENLIFIWCVSVIAIASAQLIAKYLLARVYVSLQYLSYPNVLAALNQHMNFSLFLQSTAYMLMGVTIIVTLSSLLIFKFAVKTIQ